MPQGLQRQQLQIDTKKAQLDALQEQYQRDWEQLNASPAADTLLQHSHFNGILADYVPADEVIKVDELKTMDRQLTELDSKAIRERAIINEEIDFLEQLRSEYVCKSSYNMDNHSNLMNDTTYEDDKYRSFFSSTPSELETVPRSDVVPTSQSLV